MSRITKIEQQKRNKKRYNIFINDVYFASASEYIVTKFKLKEGDEVSLEQLKAAIFEDSVEKAKGYVIDYLLSNTKKEIQTKLKDKGYDEEVIQRVMLFLDEYNIIDEQQYANSFVSDGIRLKKLGPMMIRQKLKQKGIPDECIEEALAAFQSKNEEEEFHFAKRALSTKIHTYQRKANSPYELKGKCYQYLASRGYDSNIIQGVIEESLRELEEEE